MGSESEASPVKTKDLSIPCLLDSSPITLKVNDYDDYTLAKTISNILHHPFNAFAYAASEISLHAALLALNLL